MVRCQRATINYAEQHVGLLAAEAGARHREVDSLARGVFGRLLDTRTDADEMNRPSLSDDPA